MAFVVQDLQDLIGLLEQHPGWKSALRASLLGDDVLQLPAVVRELAEAQKRTEQRVDVLAQRLDALTQRVDALTRQVAELVEAQKRTEQRIEELAEAQKRTEERIGRLEDRVGALEGSDLERTYRERSYAFFQRILKAIHVVAPRDLQKMLDDAVDAGRIAEDEKEEILYADVIVSGRRDGQSAYLVAEVSATVRVHDVERAIRRSQLLGKASGVPALAAVAGRGIQSDAETEARARGVWRVFDGVVLPPA
jgi:DNA repair exonuclease SbcCD ATPase subunit